MNSLRSKLGDSMRFNLNGGILIALALFMMCWLGGCATSPADSSGQTASASPGAQIAADIANSEDPTAGLPTLAGQATVEMVVNGASITISLDGDRAPVTAGNFLDLVNRGVYDGLSFHRVVREPQPFVVQGGDPQSNDPQIPPQRLGTGSFIDPVTNAPRYIPLEVRPESAEQPLYNQTFEAAAIAEAPALPHYRGAVAMARSQAVDSASSQFYIALTDLPFLDGSYAVFGYVKDGMTVVDQIQQGDVIEFARVVDGLENLQTSN